jgi:hypothetical protein
MAFSHYLSDTLMTASSLCGIPAALADYKGDLRNIMKPFKSSGRSWFDMSGAERAKLDSFLCEQYENETLNAK